MNHIYQMTKSRVGELIWEEKRGLDNVHINALATGRKTWGLLPILSSVQFSEGMSLSSDSAS